MENDKSLETIVCKKCNTEKPIVDFYKCKSTKIGRFYTCKKCTINSSNSRRKKISSNLYVITNPAYREYVKVGRASDVSRRLNSYQTSSPFRDYEVYFYVFTEHVLEIERYFQNEFECLNEWVKMTPEEAKQEILKKISEL